MSAGAVARAWFERVWQQREIGAIRELAAMDAIGHLRNCDIVGPFAFEQLWHGYFAAFPDMEMEIQDIVAEGDKAVVRWKVRGTHTGDSLGIPPSGRQVEFTGMTMLEVKEGKIVEGWDEWDFGGLMAKLGAP
jgi:steroid delta-isomerase-like uncharacterized protein